MKLFLLVSLFVPSVADPFLARIPLDQVPEKMKRELLAEIEVVLGTEHRNGTENRFGPIETLLRPTFNALPKNSYGKLDHTSVRYAVHRLFVQRHRWVINGQDAGSETSIAAPASQMLKDRVPEIVQELFEQRTATHGASLHDVALLAATLEHLVHAELSKKLEGVYQVRDLALDAVLTLEQAEDLVGLYMMGFVRGLDLPSLSTEQVQWLEQHIHKLYPPWKPAQQFWLNILRVAALDKEQFAFSDVANMLAAVGDRFAEWQDSQCHVMKDMLLEMEDRGSGRVRLVNFYKAAIYEGKYQFTETINYLRQIGTLDETDPLNPRVIIPNYISGLSNCIARTDYYSVCCLDECESLLGHLERQLGKPEATPVEVAALVERLPSATVPKERGLSVSLRRRLDEMAQHHSGFIPLHGRLFAQWMHLAYPRECLYPHLSGTTYKKTMEQWENETGERSGSTLEEIVQWTGRLEEQEKLGQLRPKQDGDAGEDGHSMWTMDEELFVGPAAGRRAVVASTRRSKFAIAVTSVFFVAALASVLFGLGGRGFALFGYTQKKSVEKFVL